MDSYSAIPDIEQFFNIKDFASFWIDAMSVYSGFGFTDKLTDDERIAEVTYIHEQFKKYVGSHMDQILKHKDSPENMKKVIEDLISKAPQKPKTRRELMYMSIRDQWLLSLYWTVAAMLPGSEE